MPTEKHPHRPEDIDDQHVLSNGAVIQRMAYSCEVCVGRQEQASMSVFIVEYKGQQVHLCDAHCQQLLDLDWDKIEKEGGIFQEMFSGL